ncbi:MAG: hypothetical protein NTW29_14900 [Bacteroidetes bacterium]|nr:hypothetical protein [Bacteroidota bacterium]
MFRTIFGLFLSTGVLIASIAQAQTYNTFISDKEYIDFINKDILRDSIKVKHRIFRIRHKLYPDELYYKDTADFSTKNTFQNTHFIFKKLSYGNNKNILTNQLDTIFTRRDIDFFGEQLRAMKNDTTWTSSFVNSVLIDSVEYDKKDKRVWGRRLKWPVWRYSLPLFSADRRYAIIIKSTAFGGGYYIYKRIENGDWMLIKILNQWAEC